MATVPPWQLLAVFMGFVSCRNLVLSENLFRKYPYWSDYLTDPHALQLKHYLTSPIYVWPSRLFENYTKLTVSKECCG